jgi:hypothetical protein
LLPGVNRENKLETDPMNILRTAAIGGLFYGLWHFLRGQQHQPPAAFAHGQEPGPNVSKVRDAGPEAMRDTPKRPWTKTDEEIDESFPASDPPSNY